MYKNDMPLLKRIALPLIFILISFTSASTLFAQDSLANLPELSLPLTSQKLIVAHCMTHIIRYEGRQFEDGCNPDYYPITSPIGGYTQVHPMCDSMLQHATLDQAVEYEMRAAKRCGIDGFQFYYRLDMPIMDSIIEAYFRVATEKNIDFKFTFCFSHPRIEGMDENMKLLTFAIRVNKILNDVGRDNTHWLRTPDGRLIVYLWYGEQIADIPTDNMQGRPAAFYVADAYRKLANACGERFACLYSINAPTDKSELDDLLDYFPGLWLWTEAYEHKGEEDLVANFCKKRKRAYAASVFPDFYTSKVLKPNDPDWTILSEAEAEAAGTSGMQRKNMITGLSQTFRNGLEFAIKNDAPLVNVITWNDYPEGHNLAPEINHNFGFAVLLNYYKSVLQGKPSPYQDRDVAIAFFKKYKSNVTPKPYNVSIQTLGRSLPEISAQAAVAIEDSIEVVTILPSPAQLVVNGETVDVPAGLHSQRFKSQPGAVSVAIQRNGMVTKSFVTPEWITDNPLRTDRLTYTFDTEFQSFFHDIFGDIPPIYSTQYNKNVTK
jgi:hypothetical protein